MDIRQAVEEILFNGGLTIDPFTQYQPTNGFAVSIPGEEEVFKRSTIDVCKNYKECFQRSRMPI